MTRAGTLVVVEGIDGSGKSTLCRGLADAVRARDAEREVVLTKEPTDGVVGSRIRALAAEGRRLPPLEELLLFEEDRAEHARELVVPALARGATIIQDRGFHSTAAYQGRRGVDVQEILRRSRALAPEPDVLVAVDLSVEAALARVGGRGASDAFEERDQLEEVAAYFAQMNAHLRLDGRQPPEALVADVLAHLGL